PTRGPRQPQSAREPAVLPLTGASRAAEVNLTACARDCPRKSRLARLPRPPRRRRPHRLGAGGISADTPRSPESAGDEPCGSVLPRPGAFIVSAGNWLDPEKRRSRIRIVDESFIPAADPQLPAATSALAGMKTPGHDAPDRSCFRLPFPFVIR